MSLAELLALISACTCAYAQKARTGDFRVDVKSGFYAIHVPADYDPAKTYPMIVWIHGSTQSGEGNRDLWARHLKDRNRLNEFIVVAPHQEWMSTRKGSPATDRLVITESVKDALSKYKTDPKRNILSSHSGGGPPSQELITSMPKEFAAFAPWSNNFRSSPPRVGELADKPLLLMWGERDHELIISKDAYGTSGEGPAFHSALSSQKLRKYQMLIVPRNDHGFNPRIADIILAFYDQVALENTVLTPGLTGIWNDIRTLKWSSAMQGLEKEKKAGADALNALKKSFGQGENALNIAISSAENSSVRALLFRLGAHCWKGHNKEKDFESKATGEESKSDCDKTVVDKCLNLIIGCIGADNKKRVETEKKLRALRASLKDGMGRTLAEYCLARIWCDAFGFLLIQRTWPH